MFNNWISIFFQLLNFFILVAVGYYVYRKYLKGTLEEKMNQKEAVLKGLEEQGHFLEGRSQDLDEQRVQQERHTNVLMQKVNEWNEAVACQRYKEQEENRIFAANNVERVNLKNEYIAQHELKMQIAPIVLANAKELLQKKFTDETLKANYVHDVINNLKESTNHG